MILFNFTGLSRTHWLPTIERAVDGPIWFVSVRWLQVEVIIYSVEMATEFIRRLNRSIAERGGE